MHTVTDNMKKKIAQGANVRTVFSAPNKLDELWKITHAIALKNRDSKENDKNKFVYYAEYVPYHIPLSCGRKYVGQSSCCLNNQ